MKGRVQLRPAAELDLKQIYWYSDKKFGRDRAERYIRDLDRALQCLADDPQLGRDGSEIKPGLMIYQVVSHIVFFRIVEEGIAIIRVLHKSMDYKRHL